MAGAAVSYTLLAINFGAYAITWPSGTKWPGGTVPTLSTSGTDILVFCSFNGGTTWYANLAGLAYA